MQNKSELKSTEIHASIKLGIDAHAKWFYVARQVDGATPQPVQKMTFEGLLRFVAPIGVTSQHSTLLLTRRLGSGWVVVCRGPCE